MIPGYFLKRTQEEFRAPIMTGAMDLNQSIKRLEALAPAKRSWLLQPPRSDFPRHPPRTPRHHSDWLCDGRNGRLDFSGFAGSVYVSSCDTSETIRMLRLSVPVKQIMDETPLCLAHDEFFDNAKKTLLNTEYHGLPVLRDGNFVGVVTRESFHGETTSQADPG